MLATYRRLETEAEKLTEAAKGDQDPSASKKKRAREARKLAARVKAALDDGRIEEDIKGVKMEKVFSRASTKQAMIARVRIFHLSSSAVPQLSDDRGIIAPTCARAAHQPLTNLRRVRV